MQLYVIDYICRSFDSDFYKDAEKASLKDATLQGIGSQKIPIELKYLLHRNTGRYNDGNNIYYYNVFKLLPMLSGGSSGDASGGSHESGSFDLCVSQKRSHIEELGSSDESDKKIKRIHLESLGDSKDSFDLTITKKYLEELGSSVDSAEFSKEAFIKAYYDNLKLSKEESIEMDTETIIEEKSTSTLMEMLETAKTDKFHVKKGKNKNKTSTVDVPSTISSVASEHEERMDVDVDSEKEVETFLGDYMNRWDATGGKILSPPVSDSIKNVPEVPPETGKPPMPSPRMKRKTSKQPLDTEGLSFYLLINRKQ